MKKLIIIISALLLVSCATSTQKEIERESRQMPVIHGKTDMMNKMHQAINHSKLSFEQKKGFSKIHHRVFKQSARLNSDIRKMKVLLFRSLTSDNYNESKVYRLKKQVKKLYEEKIDVMFDAFEEVQEVLGKEGLHFLSNKKVEEIHLKAL